MKTITVRDLRQRWPRAEAMLERERSEEHTSELQSPCNLVCRLLLEKKKVYIDRVIRAVSAHGSDLEPHGRAANWVRDDAHPYIMHVTRHCQPLECMSVYIFLSVNAI